MIAWRLSFLFPTHDIADRASELWMRHLQVYKHWSHVYMNPDIFETAYFFIPIRVDGVFDVFEEWFQSNAVLMSGFTGFLWTEGRFV